MLLESVRNIKLGNEVELSIELFALLAAVFTFISAAIGAFMVIWNAISKVSREVADIHIIINSRLEELLELTRKTAHAAGMKQGKEEEK